MVECNFVVSIECNSHETSNLSATPLDNQRFRLKKINEIKYYFICEIRKRELMSKRLRKYIAFCDFFNKSLIVLSATSGSVSIASFTTVIETLVRIARASLTLTFSLSTGLVKKLLKTAWDKKGSTIRLLSWLN